MPITKTIQQALDRAFAAYAAHGYTGKDGAICTAPHGPKKDSKDYKACVALCRGWRPMPKVVRAAGGSSAGYRVKAATLMQYAGFVFATAVARDSTKLYHLALPGTLAPLPKGASNPRYYGNGRNPHGKGKANIPASMFAAGGDDPDPTAGGDDPA